LPPNLFGVTKKPSKESIVEKRATLKRSAAGLDIHTDPTTWWVYEDEYLRNEMGWFDLFNESEKKKYTSGEYDKEKWSLIQRKIVRWKSDTQKHINGILRLKHDILRKIHEHGVEGPGYLSPDVKKLCRPNNRILRDPRPPKDFGSAEL
jgi:hypothetical protein